MNDPLLSPSELQKVLILAPYRRDADYMRQLLLTHEIAASIATDVQTLAESLHGFPGVLVATHEALKPEVLETVAAHLQSQPSWSELPVVVLLDKNARTETLRAHLNRAWPRARLLFYHRPIRPAELISGVQSGLLARRRQHDLFENIQREVELRRELNHRVKNILASVTSIFEMTARQSASLDDLKEDFRGRLTALAGVHSTVFDAEGEQVSLTAVAALIFGPYRQKGSDRILASGPSILLNREAATTIALCLHELATNAIKYGALSVAEGRVELNWSLDQKRDALSLEWTERDGPPAQEPGRLGYGSRYLRSALTMLFGNPPTFRYAAQGFRFSVTGNISRLQ